MRMDRLTEPLAITMWDSSWLRRRYDGGGFESFDKALDELTGRGYNAVRIDAFPHMISGAPDDTVSERFLDPAGFGFHWYGFAQWGSPWTVYIDPRKDIVDFLKKCEARRIRVLLSTWLKPTAEPRNEWLKGEGDHVRIWDDTLRFLERSGCLGPVIGVDVQNEIPFGAVYPWLGGRLKELRTPEKQAAFVRRYYGTVLRELRRRWPGMPFGVSGDRSFTQMHADYEDCDFLDVHLWAEDAPCRFLDGTRYRDAIAHFGDKPMIREKRLDGYLTGKRLPPPDIDFERIGDEIHAAWEKNRAACAEWLEERIAATAAIGKEHHIPVGCTEGWGSIMWAQHPLLGWDMIKEAGLIAAKLARRYGYAFCCQSNFCAPQYASLWKDISYHRQVTGIIRGLNDP